MLADETGPIRRIAVACEFDHGPFYYLPQRLPSALLKLLIANQISGMSEFRMLAVVDIMAIRHEPSLTYRNAILL